MNPSFFVVVPTPAKLKEPPVFKLSPPCKQLKTSVSNLQEKSVAGTTRRLSTPLVTDSAACAWMWTPCCTRKDSSDGRALKITSLGGGWCQPVVSVLRGRTEAGCREIGPRRQSLLPGIPGRSTLQPRRAELVPLRGRGEERRWGEENRRTRRVVNYQRLQVHVTPS